MLSILILLCSKEFAGVQNMPITISLQLVRVHWNHLSFVVFQIIIKQTASGLRTLRYFCRALIFFQLL
jgi:hypothetical protein